MKYSTITAIPDLRIMYGDMVTMKDSPEDGILIVAYDKLVSLKNPKSTYSCTIYEIERGISAGELRKVTRGTTVTLEQE